MDKNLAILEPAASVLDRVSSASSTATEGRVHKALALCVGILLGLLAYSLHPPQSRLLVVAISVFAIIFVFMMLFWLVRLLGTNSSRIQSAKQETMPDFGV